RGCPAPNEHADETISRCARKIAEGDEIRDVATFCIGIGRMLVRELNRAPGSKIIPLEKAPEPRTLPAQPEYESERRTQCFERCLETIPAMDRDLILRYYQGEKGEKIQQRKALARLYGIPANTLRMRALRVRERLQSCVENCCVTKTKDVS